MTLSAIFLVKLLKKSYSYLTLAIFLKFFGEKQVLKRELKFQHAYMNGENPKIKDIKIYNFSIARLGKKGKLEMSQPIQSIIIRAQ